MIAVCVKWVDLRPDIDSLTGAVTTDVRRHGFSAGDQAALEVALRLAEHRATTVTIVCCAPAAAERSLRELAASGATAIVRVDDDGGADSAGVGASLAATVDRLGRPDDDVELVLAGAVSADRGSGSVPGFVAHGLGWPQALGLVEVDEGPPLTAVRRLDGGRREHLRIDGPAVLSVEGSIARLRRASMRQVIAAKDLPLTVVDGPAPTTLATSGTAPIRPRARVLPAPHGDRALARIVELTGALVERTPPRRIEADPATAAAEIVSQLRAWGYLE